MSSGSDIARPRLEPIHLDQWQRGPSLDQSNLGPARRLVRQPERHLSLFGGERDAEDLESAGVPRQRLRVNVQR